jgi:hypothetical protein
MFFVLKKKKWIEINKEQCKNLLRNNNIGYEKVSDMFPIQKVQYRAFTKTHKLLNWNTFIFSVWLVLYYNTNKTILTTSVKIITI